MARVPTAARPRAWTPPLARIEGDRLLKARQAEQRVREAQAKVEMEARRVEEMESQKLDEKVDELRTQLDRLTDDLPKILPSGGGGKRMVAKVLARDYPDLSVFEGLSKADGNFIVADGSAWTVESGATARASLGLGTAATTAATDYATAAQGALANTAMQPATYDPAGKAEQVLTVGDLLDDDTFAGATAANVPSAESTKAYVDNRTALIVDNVATLRLLGAGTLPTTAYLRGFYSTLPGLGEGHLYHDQSDASSADNGVTIFVDAAGRRWKRLHKGDIPAEFAGCVPDDDSFDNTEELTALLALGVPVVLNGLYYHSGPLSTTNIPTTIYGRNTNRHGLVFTGTVAADSAAWAFTQANPDDYIRLADMCFRCTDISLGMGLYIDADLQAYERVAQWSDIRRISVGGMPDPTALTSGNQRYETPYGFDQAMVRLDQAHNLLFEDCEIFGRQIIANTGRARYAVTDKLLYISCPANAASAPYLHPTGLRIINPRFSWGNTGIDVFNDFEGLQISGGEIVGTDYGITIVAESSAAPRVLVEINDMHINAFVRNLHIENVEQNTIAHCTFYKRNDTDVRTTGISLKNADDTSISDVRYINNSAADDVEANKVTYLKVDSTSYVFVKGGKASRCDILVDGSNASQVVKVDSVFYTPFNSTSVVKSMDGTSSADVTNSHASMSIRNRYRNPASFTTGSAGFLTVTGASMGVINVQAGDRFRIKGVITNSTKTTQNFVRMGLSMGGTATLEVNETAYTGSSILEVAHAEFLASPSENGFFGEIEAVVTASGTMTATLSVSALGSDLTIPIGGGYLIVEGI